MSLGSKNGIDSVRPLRGPELRALRKLQREYPNTPYIFVTERGGPMTDSNVRKMVKRAGENAEIGFPIHPHMLRHSTGYKLANDGQDTRAIQHYMGHKNIRIQSGTQNCHLPDSRIFGRTNDRLSLRSGREY